MNRFALVCLLCAPVLALSQQEAKAWCKFGMGGSFNICFESGGKHLSYTSENPPCCDTCPAPGCYGYAGGVNNFGYAVAPAPVAPAPTAATPVVPAAWYYAQPAYAPAYYSPAAAYGYYPAYWYGR
jgi:hypothetical protein